MEEEARNQNLPGLARVVIYNKQGQVLLVRDKKWGWNHPGGRIEEGENPEEAAKREVFEETNLVVKNLKKIGEENIFFASLPVGNQNWKCYFYQAQQYSGELCNSEPEKILEIKFVNWNSPEAKKARQSYQVFFLNLKNKQENRSNPAKKNQVSLFYLLKKFPLLSLIHYGLALFSAFGSTQLIFGYLADALKKGGAEILKNNAGSFLLRLLTFGITIYLHIAIGIYLEELYTSHLRKKITKKFLSANFNQAQKEKFILSRFDSDAAIVGTLAVRIFNRSFYSVCQIVLLLWGLSKKSEEKRLIPWCLAALLFLIILVPTLYYFSYRYKLKRDREFDRENKRFKELKDNLEYIKTTGAEDREIQQSQQQFTNNLRRNYAFVLTKSIYATIPSYILVRFIPFTFLVISGQASKAILYAKLDKMFDACKTIFEMFWAYGGYESYSSSRKRLNETLANLEKYQISVPAPNYLPANRNNIIFQQVHFTYPQTKKKILDNFSFNFQKGKKYLITGPNGIGKSTLFRLIVKLYTPQQGIIKLDDTGLEKIDNSTWREKIVYLANHPYFFNTSLGNNIVYPETYQENLHREKLEATAQKLGIREFIDYLPYRWETIIAEKGQNLSAGQKQLVSLMRALVRDYEIYLFDEFLSNVNPNLKKHIQKVVFSELKNKTIIVISHEKETWNYGEEIYEFTPQKLVIARE